MTYKLIGVGNNAKTIKGDGSEYMTGILYMTPWQVMVDGNLFNSCSMAVLAGCIEGCLNTAGRGAMNSVQTARQRKAEWFYRDRDSFMAQLVVDVTKFQRYCVKRGIQPCVRLNGTTDIRWELIKVDGFANIFEMFPEIQFYDYTKIPTRKVEHIPNYHLTWSYSEANDKYARLFDTVPNNKAVVFRTKDLPSMFKGLKVINGDTHDMRFLDEPDSVVGLKAKGQAKKDASGFVIDVLQIA